MRFLSILSFVLFFSLGAYAQNDSSENEIKVYLKNGSVLKGELVDYNPNENLVFILNGHEITLAAKEVKKIVMTASSSRKNISKIKEGKLYHRTNIGLLSNANGNGISLNYSALYLHKHWFGLGIGTGIDNYYFREGRNVYPVFLEFRSYLVDANSSPYVSLKSGYGIIFADEDLSQVNARGGFILNPTFGYRIGSQGLMTDIYLGLRFQRANYDIDTGWETRQQEIQWNRVEMGAAISF